MSDYLHNLVARTLGQAPLVQPRLASRFETAQAGGEPDLALLDVEHRPAHPPVLHPPDTDSKEPDTPHRLAVPPGAEPTRAATDLDIAPATTSAPPPSNSAIELARGQPAPLVPVAAQEVTLVVQPVAPPILPSAPALMASEAQDNPREHWPAVERIRPSAGWVEPLAAPSAAAPAPTRRQPAVDPPPAPTIRVTIGRVEVRAVLPPPAPARTPAPATPKLSLDEYLRSRNGGRR